MNSFDHLIKATTQHLSELSTLSAEYALQQSKYNLAYYNALTHCYGEFCKQAHQQKDSNDFFNSGSTLLSQLSATSAKYLSESMILATTKTKESETLFNFNCPYHKVTESNQNNKPAETKK
ncbi:hypothetical protein AVI51_00480 [Piscirickettsia salmonis]|uniref:Uncharacterized protein n=1 Tax=Piscirickettsia salmonis TaxID=1238 RepID=A0A9Q5VEF7_PISSA|nr:hypothetical protein [Piscirickettsia salmonis]ALA24524.1 hypothetical protein KW89_1056 [Piscirickettsia salmonis]APS44878.1 hypothetical protein AVI48_11210 [Piscirickettsia salmonis]APS48238.1 hypothetical protein AVI49_11815 [Piscirickettsia salmonis]APS49505.1 hypothetical protein AVI50_00505 [Piscirickettsia salmonis]APS52684.1 hypothetical protein AVI51_00480 [Piscirickettsia salmonis]